VDAKPAVFIIMTNDDIIKAAFKVWGREFYQTTSHSQLSGELGVSKPALYRHFRDKEALLDAMYVAFYDEFAAFIKGGYEKVSKMKNKNERCFYMNQLIAEYYIRNKEAFVFSLIQVLKNRSLQVTADEFRARGVDIEKLIDHNDSTVDDPGSPPPVFQLMSVTTYFWIAAFHCFGNNLEEQLSELQPSEEQIQKALVSVNNRVSLGLGLQAKKVNSLDYAALEHQASQGVYEETEDNKLLRAVAGAVAVAGPWNASMEMVARRSGLSKSGLYAHFKNKKDMIAQLFITEFTWIIDYARMNISGNETPEEQLYLVIISIADYLRSRPEILIALDWVKTRRLELGFKEPPPVKHPVFSQVITDINLDALKGPEEQKIGQWVLFMIVNTLMRGELQTGTLLCKVPLHNVDFSAVTNESFRMLYRYITLGLKGFDL
jgi:AcrR family transcriptional regulator